MILTNTNKLPYFISGVFVLCVILIILSSTGFAVYLPFDDPCQQGDIACPIGAPPINLIHLLRGISYITLVILLAVQLLIQVIQVFKKP